jgi:hypothetical protein
MKACEEVWCIDSYFLDLGTSWRWVVSFTPRPLYPRGKSPWYPLNSRLGGAQNWSGRRGEEKVLDPTVTRTATPRSFSPIAGRYTDCAFPAPPPPKMVAVVSSIALWVVTSQKAVIDVSIANCRLHIELLSQWPRLILTQCIHQAFEDYENNFKYAHLQLLCPQSPCSWFSSAHKYSH